MSDFEDFCDGFPDVFAAFKAGSLENLIFYPLASACIAFAAGCALFLLLVASTAVEAVIRCVSRLCKSATRRCARNSTLASPNLEIQQSSLRAFK